MTALWWQAIMLQSSTLWLWWLMRTASSLSILAYATKQQYSSSCRSSAFWTSMILATPVSSLRVTRVRPAISFKRTMRPRSPILPLSVAACLSDRSSSTCFRESGVTTLLRVLVLDSRRVLVSSVSRGLNCINMSPNQSYMEGNSHNGWGSTQSYISMSKKLWQAIGVWNTHSPPQQQPETPNNSSNPADSKVEVVIGASSCDAGEAVEKREQLSLEIESCQSQQMRSEASHKQLVRPSNGEIAWCQSNLFVEKAYKMRIGQLAQQAKQLQGELEGIRSTVQKERKSIGRDLQAILDTFQQQFSKRTEVKPIVVACQRCEQSKAMIDQLTRQCWQLENKLKEQKEKAEEKVMKEDHPMKKIENSLLQERAQAMKRLKSQVQQLRQENQGLYLQLSEKEQLLQQMETQYKKSLLAFKTQIEVIGQACSNKIQQIIQEKTAIQAEFHLLRDKHFALQEANQLEQIRRNADLQQIRRNADKRYFTQHPQTFNFPSATDLQIPFNKQVPIRQTQTPHARNISSRNTSSLIDLDLSQLDSSSQAIPVSHAHARRQPYLQAPKKTHLFFEAPSLSRTSLKSSQLSMGSALQRLSQLQKDVRKEINRSKKSIK